MRTGAIRLRATLEQAQGALEIVLGVPFITQTKCQVPAGTERFPFLEAVFLLANVLSGWTQSPSANARSLSVANMIGTRIMTAMVDVNMPPTIGAAIGFITS